MPTADLARQLIAYQFPHWADLPITEVAQQGHDNRTYRLGHTLLIRMPTEAAYAQKVHLEHAFLPALAQRLSIVIPIPVAMGQPSPSMHTLFPSINGCQAQASILPHSPPANIINWPMILLLFKTTGGH